jgi:hypothetical protein
MKLDAPLALSPCGFDQVLLAGETISDYTNLGKPFHPAGSRLVSHPREVKQGAV